MFVETRRGDGMTVYPEIGASGNLGGGGWISTFPPKRHG
jgi:hypothetical protein